MLANHLNHSTQHLNHSNHHPTHKPTIQPINPPPINQPLNPYNPLTNEPTNPYNQPSNPYNHHPTHQPPIQPTIPSASDPNTLDDGPTFMVMVNICPASLNIRLPAP
ncbi:hypothetical protein Pmani_021379 [Petrolisthes manimaculis]|uniref:Uncharacterized protein n=1 Tax=Petrolisthes manimaculis TaxID=1843537 RepID=A0AAE1U5D0_9EUCA|nr:hypothetical protein Pmani_021379 [Petrolisthes manimaculis]